jgi:serine/threonine protein kinase
MVWATGDSLQGGRYVIEKRLAPGGFGITYKAQHRHLAESVVIKTPNESLRNDPEYDKYVRRFIEEGRRMAKLSEKQHPNIVRVRDLFEEGGTYCLVMDFVAGESLWDLVQRRGALPESEAVDYVRQIGEALTVVHAAGLVHRDAHPGNIMVQRDGKAVLIDFGIAGEIFPATVSSKFFANPAFAPYEQMQGDREPAVDIYCLAASLYYSITGQRPASSLKRKLNNERLVPPKQLAGGIGDELNRAILKGMELEANKRPQSMREWLKLLESANRTQPVSLPRGRKPVVIQLLRAIPWLGFARVLLSYTILGFCSAHQLVALAGAGALALVSALLVILDSDSDSVALTLFWALFLFFALAFFGSVLPLVLALGSPLLSFLLWLSYLVVIPISFSGDATKQRLESFSKFQIFLIVTVISWVGLGLGCLVYQIFPVFQVFQSVK